MRKISLLFLAMVLFNACGSDEGGQNTDAENKLIIGDQQYALNFLWVNDENTTNNNPSDIGIIISSANFLSNPTATGFTYVYFDTNAVDLESQTYANVNDYNVFLNSSFDAEEGVSGTKILDDGGSDNSLHATSSSFTINNISPSSIDLTFTFTKEDGTIISGSYSGNYQQLD